MVLLITQIKQVTNYVPFRWMSEYSLTIFGKLKRGPLQWP